MAAIRWARLSSSRQLGGLRLLAGQGLGRAGRQMLVAPAPELVGVDPELGRDLLQRLAALLEQLDRLGLELGGEPASCPGHPSPPGWNRSTLATRPRRRGKLTRKQIISASGWRTRSGARGSARSEERRVGKECRSRGAPD